MRPGALAAVSLVSGVIGAAAALGLADLLGWVGGESEGTRSVVTFVEDRTAAPAAAPVAGNGFDPTALYERRAEGVVTVYALAGDHARSGRGAQGSGFVVSPDGYILTNSHVITNAGEGATGDEVEAAERVFVQFRDGERVPAEVIGFDIFDDVGVLKVDPRAHELAPVPLGDSARVAVGEPVAAIGSPFGAESSLAVGVVSATQRSIAALTSRYHLVDAIQTDAPINRGNSGGPLFDARGRVIGINAQIRSDTGLAEGVGFAVPINAAKRSMAELIEHGRVRYAYVGIGTEDLTPQLARHLRLPVQRGALIAEVQPTGPARAAGLRGGTRTIVFQGLELEVGGDVVVAVDGRPVRNGDELVRMVTNDLRPAQTAVFSVVRGSRRLQVRIELAERPIDPAEG